MIYGVHVALRHFLTPGHGVVVNVGSVDSEVPLAHQGSYAATEVGGAQPQPTAQRGTAPRRRFRYQGRHDRALGGRHPWWTHAANYTGHEPRMAAMEDPGIVVEACITGRKNNPAGWTAHGSNISHHLLPDLTERLSAEIADAEIAKAAAVAPNPGSIHQPSRDGTGIDGGIRARTQEEDHSSALVWNASIVAPGQPVR